MGFPEIENAATPSITLPKVIACLARRQQRLDECMDALDTLKKKKEEGSRVANTLSKFPSCKTSADVISIACTRNRVSKDDRQDQTSL